MGGFPEAEVVGFPEVTSGSCCAAMFVVVVVGEVAPSVEGM